MCGGGGCSDKCYYFSILEVEVEGFCKFEFNSVYILSFSLGRIW